jgi:hypothetical protein
LIVSPLRGNGQVVGSVFPMRTKWLVAVAALAVCAVAHAQEPRVIVVPYPGSSTPDAGTADVAQPPPPPPNTQPAPQPLPPSNDPNAVPPPPPPEPPRTIDAVSDTGDVPPPPPPDLTPKEVPASPPSAMLDGHPREGAFLSGPGSLTFILHHTLLGLTMGVATQLFPRVLNTNPDVNRCDSPSPASVCGQDARLAYLASGLLGAGLGFATSAAWQFYHWMSDNTAWFGLANSIFGGMFGAGFVNLVTSGDAAGTAWGAWIGALAGAWVTAIVGGGELATNRGLLMLSGAYWAEMLFAVIVACLATTGSGNNTRAGIDALMLAPALGAGGMALALLKFNPSSAQILRADLFGTLAGAAVLVVAGLVLGVGTGFTKSPVPYILGGVAAAGAITTVSLLWAEAAENPPPAAAPPPAVTPGQPVPAPAPKPAYQGVW